MMFFLLILIDPPFFINYKANLHHIDWLGGLNFPSGKPSLLATYPHSMPSSNKIFLVFLSRLYKSHTLVHTLEIHINIYLHKEM